MFLSAMKRGRILPLQKWKKLMLREITEITSGHTTNKYKGWDSKSSIRGLLQSHTFPTEQHNNKLQRGTLSVPTSIQGNRIHQQKFLNKSTKSLNKEFFT